MRGIMRLVPKKREILILPFLIPCLMLAEHRWGIFLNILILSAFEGFYNNKKLVKNKVYSYQDKVLTQN